VSTRFLYGMDNVDLVVIIIRQRVGVRVELEWCSSGVNIAKVIVGHNVIGWLVHWPMIYYVCCDLSRPVDLTSYIVTLYT
jgi:hypothetical protein